MVQSNLLSFVDDLAEELESEQEIPEGLCVGSLDVVGLYPSLDIEKCAKICQERIYNSEMKFAGVDYKAATHYLAMTHEQVEITKAGLGTVVPMRRHKQGSRPGITGLKDDPDGERWKW